VRLWDAVVVGAGPAGALAAHDLARSGASVLLVDRAAFPRWKVCGACLSPGARVVLERAGLGDVPEGLAGVPLRLLRLHGEGRSASIRLGRSLALSRSALDHALVRAAERAGARFWPRARVSLGGAEQGARRLRILREGVPADVRARVVVDASGLGRGLRAPHDPPDRVAPGSRLGVGAVLVADDYPVEPGDLHMAVGRTGYVGLVRVEDGRLTVAAAIDPGRLRAESPGEAVSSILVSAGLPPLAGEPSTAWRGTPLLTRSSGPAGAERLFRVGDATGYVEPFTGEGICWALSAGRAVARVASEAIEQWSDDLIHTWEMHRARTLVPSQRLCRALARALRSPWLVRLGLATLDVAPGVAGPFVARAALPPGEAA